MDFRRHLRPFVLGLLLLAGPAHAGNRIIFWMNNFQAPELSAALIKDFSRQSGVGVDIRYIEGGSYKPELIKHALDDEAPQVVLIPADFLAMDQELNFSEIPASGQKKDIILPARLTGLHDKRQLGAPVYWGNHMVMYYNRDLVKVPATSFEELERQAPALKARALVPIQFLFGEMYTLVPFIGAFGGWPLDENDAATLNTPAMVQALDFIFDLAARDMVRKDCHDACGPKLFAENKAAYYIGGDWMYGKLSQEMGARLGVAALPTIAEKPMVSMYSSYVLAFPNDSLNGPQRKSLLKFIAYMQSPAVQTRWAREGKLFPVHAKVFKDYTASAPKNIQIALKELQRSRVMSNHRNMAFVWAGMSRGFSAIYNGRATAPQAAEQMQKAATSMIRRAPP